MKSDNKSLQQYNELEAMTDHATDKLQQLKDKLDNTLNTYKFNYSSGRAKKRMTRSYTNDYKDLDIIMKTERSGLNRGNKMRRLS